MILGMSYFQICVYFLLYSFIGWVIEVAFHAITKGTWVNRGFLNGPICPIYGFSMLAILALCHVFSGHSAISQIGILPLFIGGTIIATLVELLGGWLLDSVFHLRWWDYSKRKFNFHGYICPLFSVLWGAGIVIFVKWVDPLISQMAVPVTYQPPLYAWYILLALYILTFADAILSIATALGLSRKIKELDKLSKAAKKPANLLSQGIAAGTIAAANTVEKSQVQMSLAKMELADRTNELVSGTAERVDMAKAAGAARVDAVRTRYQQLAGEVTAHRHFGTGRLLRAFPSMESREYHETLSDLKSRIGSFVRCNGSDASTDGSTEA